MDKSVDIYNAIRPHEQLDFYTPLDAFHGRFVPNPEITQSVLDC